MPADSAWPELPLGDWADTYATLHMWTQIVGKTRLALAPMQNHWWQVTLYVTPRGLTTSPIAHGDGCFAVDFDFIDHSLWIRASDGSTRKLTLNPRPVAGFYAEYMATLASLGIRPHFKGSPAEVLHAVRFDEDRTHRFYDANAAQRWWRILVQVDRIMKRFAGRFLGKASPAHFFWGGFDLAATRFSGRRAPRHGGGIPNCPDYVQVEAYSHECSSCGFWPGGGVTDEPAFYAYAYPQPRGYEAAAILPKAAHYSTAAGEFILPYEAVRASPDPEEDLLNFFQSAYNAAADLSNWDRAALERPAAEWPSAKRHPP